MYKTILLLQRSGQGEDFFALNFLYVQNNIAIAEKWTGRRLLHTKFFTCIKKYFHYTILLLQRTGLGEDFFTLNFLCVLKNISTIACSAGGFGGFRVLSRHFGFAGD